MEIIVNVKGRDNRSKYFTEVCGESLLQLHHNCIYQSLFTIGVFNCI
jgi:hypothetical protein